MTLPTRIFITGASSGLGAGLARHYAGPGTHLGLVARRADLLEALSKELVESGAKVQVYAQDVTDTKQMEAIAKDFLAHAGGVDLVIANAGVGIRSAVLKGESCEVAWLMGINVIGVTNTLIPFIPSMVEQGSGALVGMSSMAGHRAFPGRSAYCASKRAVITFMDGLRLDLHGTGVHAMAICPGFVRTPLIEDNPSTPFVVELPDAIHRMTRAIRRRRRTFTFPWQMNLLRYASAILPERLILRFSPKPRTRSSR